MGLNSRRYGIHVASLNNDSIKNTKQHTCRLGYDRVIHPPMKFFFRNHPPPPEKFLTKKDTFGDFLETPGQKRKIHLDTPEKPEKCPRYVFLGPGVSRKSSDVSFCEKKKFHGGMVNPVITQPARMSSCLVPSLHFRCPTLYLGFKLLAFNPIFLMWPS